MFDALQNEFEGELYFKNTTTDKALKKVYSTDASVYQEEPLAVAIPKTVNDIKKLIKFADNEQNLRFFRKYGFRLDVQTEIIIIA